MNTELITNVAHDLKTPLTTIITYVDLFEVSKATSGNINLNMVDVDIVDLMKQTLLELDDKISEASLIVL